jgi:hypothetical protein
MQQLFILFFMFVMNISAKETIVSIELTYQTRGMQKHLHITPDSVMVSINEHKYQYPTSPKQWATIIENLKNIDLEKISTLKRPTKKAASDGAFNAFLTVNTSQKGFVSSNFDHNQPPQVLVKTIKSMKTALSKTEHKTEF